MITANMSRRELAVKAGISQPAPSEIIADTLPAKANELLAIATATGCTLTELTSTPTMADRVQYASTPNSGENRRRMREQLLHFMELDAYLDDQGIDVRA
ncbi:helix-turn-helix domain-containing protein [Rhodococcus qingshengii]|uniref:helix-turn-helix domain-containing protein n=1 Tax=Rhodococcus qingshengii TaxID=334542 RepID=UPI003F8207A0